MTFDWVEDWKFLDDPECLLTQKDIEEANGLLSKPFNFYGGYLQMPSYKKDDFLKNRFI